MREYIRLETPVFPIFLESYIPMLESFVIRMHIKTSPQRRLDFAKHLILEFYLRSGDLNQLEQDILLLQ